MQRRILLSLSVACVAAVSAVLHADESKLVFKDVAVLSLDPVEFVSHQDVLISEGRIIGIEPSQEADRPGTRVINGTGKYLIPGMMDAHAHLPGPQGLEMPMKGYLLLQLAHGVTCLRVARHEPDHLAIRHRAETEEWISPRLFLAAPMISRNSEVLAEPVEEFRSYKEAGYDHVKHLSGLTPIEHAAHVSASREVGLPFFGHLPSQLDLEQVIELRQGGIEHLHGLTTLLIAGNTDALQQAIAKLAQGRTFLCPTVTWYDGYNTNYANPREVFYSRPGLKYLPESLLQSWEEWLTNRLPEEKSGDLNVRHKVLKLLAGHEVPMLLSPGDGYFFVPGAAMLEEMKAYRNAGFSNGEILRAATYAGAEFYGQSDDFGQIKPGCRADLVLLAKNPLDQLENIHSVDGVHLGDRWIDASQLKSALAKLGGK